MLRVTPITRCWIAPVPEGDGPHRPPCMQALARSRALGLQYGAAGTRPPHHPALPRGAPEGFRTKCQRTDGFHPASGIRPCHTTAGRWQCRDTDWASKHAGTEVRRNAAKSTGWFQPQAISQLKAPLLAKRQCRTRTTGLRCQH